MIVYCYSDRILDWAAMLYLDLITFFTIVTIPFFTRYPLTFIYILSQSAVYTSFCLIGSIDQVWWVYFLIIPHCGFISCMLYGIKKLKMMKGKNIYLFQVSDSFFAKEDGE